MRVHVPMPLQVVIDDVGWWSGEDSHAQNGPFRNNMPRNHVPADYAAIVALGRRLNMRPQAAMILGEWDRENILRAVPTATWMGAAWDNRSWVGPWLEEAAGILRDGADNVEIVLHGLGHEYWADGRMTRAEWHDAEGRMRPRGQVLAHLEYFAKLMDQHGLGTFPETFVPTAFLHAFGDGQDGLAAILRQHGLRFIFAPFENMRQVRPPEAPHFGLDDGVVTVDRTCFPLRYCALDCRPEGEVAGPVVGLHWPNILHSDPARNGEVIERWVEFLAPYDRRPDRMLARDTADCWTQLAYHACTEVSENAHGVVLDFTRLGALSLPHLNDTFTVKIEGAGVALVSSPDMRIIGDVHPSAPAPRLLRLRRVPGQGRGHLTLAKRPK